MKYNLVTAGDQENLTLFVDGEMYVASESHPNWSIIKRMVVLDRDESVVDYFDVPKSVERRLSAITERISFDGESLFFDGDEVDNSLTKQIVRHLKEGVEDWKPLVAFMDKVAQNPQEHSREQLYDFLAHHDITITKDGDIVGYKSVRFSDSDDGDYKSINAGTAFVNGERKEGQIPQSVGDVVTMPRSEVAFDPSQGCSTGLHVANWNYANTWANHDAVLKVAVNPRDVVSVPSDSSWEKVRVCRYEIIGIASEEIKSPVDSYDVDEDYDESSWTHWS